VLKAPPECSSGTLDACFFQTHNTAAKSSSFINLREICDHHKLPPGEYVIVPSTFEPGEEGDYIIRVFSARKNDQVQYVCVHMLHLSHVEYYGYSFFVHCHYTCGIALAVAKIRYINFSVFSFNIYKI